MTLLNYLSFFLCIIGTLFFIASTLGLLRFPDVYSRLHVLTKADNIGLGFIVLGAALKASDLATAFKLILIWFIVLIASASSCYLVARVALKLGIKPWTSSHPFDETGVDS